MSDFDYLNIDGMSRRDAEDYVKQFVIAEKKTIQALEAKKAEVEKWKGRVELARSKGMEDLAREAEEQLNRFYGDVQKLLGELREVQHNLAILREKLSTRAEDLRTIDADVLAAEFEVLLGKDREKMKLDEKFENLSADEELKKLKEKMKNNGKV
ncbi:MAG: PspA/IM30 family protein [bacterium]